MAGPRTRRGTIALAVALTLAVPAGTFGLVLLNADAGFGAALPVGLVLGVAWIVGMVRLLGAAAGCWATGFGVVLWLMALGSVASARDSVILSTSGVTVTARVTAAYDYQQGKHPYSGYTLVDENGTPIPNGTVTTGLRSHAVGDRLAVRYDPGGVATARLPEDIDVPGELAVAFGLNAFVMAVTAGLGASVVRNGRPRRVPFPPRGMVIGRNYPRTTRARR
ncbi:hypothetical protein [Kitasatospora cathayae]|uniref:DUF3592 domain-containing protein n=1 Tax=Kitasatospora cathayae TaxID=3004092 RepID=A0ABY7Q1C4_9ACTN|nr:hypothetical protein [Kitasatospora sp. HUAS 3-15]WBP86508.1 hypothetical protein O1G21_12095 [Kitasatospora sp. HUAS 3-15]